MTVAAAIAIIQALIAAYKPTREIIESICSTVAGEHGLSAVELIRAVSTPDVAAVDTLVDAEINAHTWPVR